MYLPFDKACLAVRLLTEGSSVRSAARIVGVGPRTVLSLLAQVGKARHRLLRDRIRGFDASRLEIDEVWTFVRKKRAKLVGTDPPEWGDAYCYVALDRATRLVAAWHLGKRDTPDTCRFILKVREATSEHAFQITSDGWEPYGYAIEAGLSDRASYARIVKVTPPGRVEAVVGDPDLSQAGTSHVERFNGTLRLWNRRFARKTYACSKKREMLEASLALCFADYNFCRIHQTLQVTPAMEAGIVPCPWEIGDLLREACLRCPGGSSPARATGRFG